MSKTLPVKYYSSGMAGAPVLGDSWGALTGLLDAVLVHGFGARALDGLSYADGVATATISGGHGFELGQVLAISGADQAAYNGECRVTAITSTSFSWALDGPAPASPATGALLEAKVAPLGWEIHQTNGVHKRAYRSTDPASSKPILLVDAGEKDAPYNNASWAKWAAVGIVESMSDINTITGAQAPWDAARPNRNWGFDGVTDHFGWCKWRWMGAPSPGSTFHSDKDKITDLTARSFFVVGDSMAFYVFLRPHGDTAAAGMTFSASYAFGECLKVGVEPVSFLIAENNPSSSSSSSSNSSSYANGMTGLGVADGAMREDGKLLLSSFDGLTKGVPFHNWSLLNDTSGAVRKSSGYIYINTPNGHDFRVLMLPVYMRENLSGYGRGCHLCGQYPGLAHLPHGPAPFSDMERLADVEPGRVWMAKTCYGGQVMLDITGPWR